MDEAKQRKSGLTTNRSMAGGCSKTRCLPMPSDDSGRRSELSRTLGHDAEGSGGPPYVIRCGCGDWQEAGFASQGEAMEAHWAHVQEEARRG